MKTKDIYITQHDLQRLKKLLNDLSKENHRNDFSVQELEGEINRALVVSPKEVPENVITMNSRVLMRDVESGKDMTLWLVFPDKMDAVKNPVSILSPLGTAMIGYKVGDVFTWESPTGKKQIEVLDILYQPERVGNFSF
ncbi:MAG: rnk-1 [Deltaproteobacteria bacterium]|nr:rnk-1 [Deltaproteobacteria bacterium]